jgi:hypothetical protein
VWVSTFYCEFRIHSLASRVTRFENFWLIDWGFAARCAPWDFSSSALCCPPPAPSFRALSLNESLDCGGKLRTCRVRVKAFNSFAGLQDVRWVVPFAHLYVWIVPDRERGFRISVIHHIWMSSLIRFYTLRLKIGFLP